MIVTCFQCRTSIINFNSRQWRAKQQEEIRKRDEASEAKRDQTIRKAEGAIDQFYEDYNVTKEKNIKANKYVPHSLFYSL